MSSRKPIRLQSGCLSAIQQPLTPTSSRLPRKGPIMPIQSIERREMPLSPPVSPETQKVIPQEAKCLINNSMLYEVGSSNTDNVIDKASPFLLEKESQKVVECHESGKMDGAFRVLSPPHESECKLALEFKCQMGKAFVVNHGKWVQRELARLKEDNRLRSGSYRAWKPSSDCKDQSRSKRRFSNRSVTMTSSFNIPRANKPRVHKSTRKVGTSEGNKKVLREDKDFTSLPNFCPPLTSLPNKTNSLKVDWKGVPIDLRSDPFAHLLHQDEIQLAANLRLDCATYLTSKRRIFISRMAAYKIGKDFRKTDAQQACKIDVNKASKLWQAFDKVGWLHKKWVPD